MTRNGEIAGMAWRVMARIGENPKLVKRFA